MFTRMERSVHVSKSVESPRASQGPAATSTVVRLDSLTGMRWWAAFFVFAYHMGNLAPFKGQSLMNFGYTGVSFFFVLSGFVLTWSARPRVGARQFWWRRVARIWPSHMVALALWPTLNKIASRSCVRWKLRGAWYRMRACLLM